MPLECAALFFCDVGGLFECDPVELGAFVCVLFCALRADSAFLEDVAFVLDGVVS